MLFSVILISVTCGFEKKACLHESSHDVRGRPANDKAGFHGLVAFRYVFYMSGRKPKLAHFHDLF